MVFDDPKFGALFPTRTGPSIGTSGERTMLDALGGSAGFRTRIQTNPDGSTTMLRTKNGMPQFTTTPAKVVTTVPDNWWWHGRYDSVVGWVDRQNNPIPSNIIANSGTGWTGHGWLFDYTMPEHTKPTLSPKPSDKWGKTIIYSENKQAVITDNEIMLGRLSWPYRAPDGGIWVLTAVWMGSTFDVRAVKDVLGGDAVTVGSYTLPDGLDEAMEVSDVFVNFSPDGSKAAIMQSVAVDTPEPPYGYAYMKEGMSWAVEVSLVGGEGETPPSVSFEALDVAGTDVSTPPIAASNTKIRWHAPADQLIPRTITPVVTQWYDESTGSTVTKTTTTITLSDPLHAGYYPVELTQSPPNYNVVCPMAYAYSVTGERVMIFGEWETFDTGGSDQIFDGIDIHSNGLHIYNEWPNGYVSQGYVSLLSFSIRHHCTSRQMLSVVAGDKKASIYYDRIRSFTQLVTGGSKYAGLYLGGSVVDSFVASGYDDAETDFSAHTVQLALPTAGVITSYNAVGADYHRYDLYGINAYAHPSAAASYTPAEKHFPAQFSVNPVTGEFIPTTRFYF